MTELPDDLKELFIGQDVKFFTVANVYCKACGWSGCINPDEEAKRQ